MSIRWKEYAKIATHIPAAVATSASDIAGATTLSEALACEDSLENVSSIPITVPNRPIKGEVEAIIDNQVNPLVATLIASELAAFSIALFGVCTLER